MKKLLTATVLLLSWMCFAQHSKIMEELNPAFFKQDFSVYDQNTALYTGQLSELAYWDQADIDKMVRKLNTQYQGSFITAEIVDDKNSGAQALLWSTEHYLIIAFRGTEPSRIKDMVSDVKLWNYANHPSQIEKLANMPTGHGGFRRSLMNLISNEDLFAKINSIIYKSNSKADLTKIPVYTTGHSLGAAISQLFMECLRYKSYNFSGAYHFAPPLAVDCSENKYMKDTFGAKVYDIINYKDFVPRAGRNGVAHFGQFYRICDDGLLYREPGAYVKFSGLEYFKAFKYHSLSNHLAALRKPKNSRKPIEERSSGGHTFPCMGGSIAQKNPCK